MNLFLSTPFINDSAGGIPKVVIPLKNNLAKTLKTENIFLFHDELNAEGKKLNLFKSLNNFKPDLIHDHGAWIPFHLKVFLGSKFLRIPFVASPHGMLEKWAMNHKAIKKKIAWHIYQKHIFRCADAIIVNSESEYFRLRELGFNKAVAIIESGIDLPEVKYYPDLNQKVISKKVLYFSRINPIKGVIELLDAWKNSKARRNFGFILNIYGNSDDQAYLDCVKSRIIELNLEQSVFLKGPVYGNKKWEIYAGHDFFILPSHSENFGLVVLEALFSGLPVVTTDGAPWHHLESLGLGKTVSLKDQSLQEAIDYYAESVNNKGFISEDFAQSARSYVVDNYSWAFIVNKYISVYQWLLGEADVPSYVRLN